MDYGLLERSGNNYQFKRHNLSNNNYSTKEILQNYQSGSR